jgi:hypothetical protein
LRSSVPISAEPSAGFVGPDEPFLNVNHNVRRLHLESWSADMVVVIKRTTAASETSAAARPSRRASRAKLSRLGLITQRQTAQLLFRLQISEIHPSPITTRLEIPSEDSAEIAKSASVRIFNAAQKNMVRLLHSKVHLRP